MALSKLPDYYLDHFGTTIKSTYNGKLKDLVQYFHDIFKVKHNIYKNQTSIISKIYGCDDNKPIDNGHHQHGQQKNNYIVSALSLVQKERNKRRGLSGKNNAKVRWTPKRKEEPKNNEEKDDSAFKFGPSAMYTVPRRAPKSHTHLIGQTAAVGTSNAYSKSGYKSSARPYSSQRRSHGGYGAKKVKTYGDYEDELPHTPSGSEDDM
eukprot:742366_1